MFEVVISPVHFGEGLSCYFNFNFFYTDDKETNLMARSSPSNLLLFLKICISILISNKTNREPNATHQIFFFIYKKLLQTFRKYICLVIEFFFINSFIVVF